MKIVALATFTEPLNATAIEGEVVLSGPGVRGASFTPEAALKTCENVHAAAEKALLQRAAA